MRRRGGREKGGGEESGESLLPLLPPLSPTPRIPPDSSLSHHYSEIVRNFMLQIKDTNLGHFLLETRIDIYPQPLKYSTCLCLDDAVS